MRRNQFSVTKANAAAVNDICAQAVARVEDKSLGTIVRIQALCVPYGFEPLDVKDWGAPKGLTSNLLRMQKRLFAK